MTQTPPPILVRGHRYADIEALTEDLAARGRAWTLDHPGQWSPAEAFRGLPPEETRLVEEAAARLMRRAGSPGEIAIAKHLGEGPYAPYYAAVLDRLESGPAIPDPALREALVQSLGWPTVSRDPALRARVRALCARERRPDLLLSLLVVDDPDGDLLEVLEQASNTMTLDPDLVGTLGWVTARRAPEALPRAAAALAPQPAPTCARFLEGALGARPALAGAGEAALRAALGLD